MVIRKDMAGLGAKDILRNITALEQLIEEINFQRAKEMRQCLMSKDVADGGFLTTHGTTYWTDLFVRHFLFQTERSTDADDLLFFIRKKQVQRSRYIPKFQTEVEVYRKDSRKLPIGDPDVDWEETVYLNLIVHQFDYTVTLAVCTRTSPKELQVLKRHSQKVYASPSRRRMDTKGEVEEITYPNVCFHVDNFDEIFADMLVRDGEMVCVELVATDHAGIRQAVLFLGSIRYDALKRVYDMRASLSSKVAQRMMMGLFCVNGTQRIEFVRMRGPQGKGHAEMAVTKPKGSGAETPTSEPGISLTDLWDSEWEDEIEDRILYRHQRRLSDPSANFNSFINSGWRTRNDGSRSHSENEGLDIFADGLYEIESGDVKDAVCSTRCCSVVSCHTVEEEDEQLEMTARNSLCLKCQHFHGEQLVTNTDFCLSKNTELAKPLDAEASSSCEGKHLYISTLENQSALELGACSASISNNLSKNVFEDIDIESALLKQKRKSGLPIQTKCVSVTVNMPIKEKKLEELNLLDEVRFGVKQKPKLQKSLSEDHNVPKLLKDNTSQSLSALNLSPSKKLKQKLSFPYRVTPDGTKVFFLSDIKLDDGAYNPLWATKGFTQTFHFWKESKRAQSIPLNAFLTYVTLPWFTIITDVLDHQTSPILTF